MASGKLTEDELVQWRRQCRAQVERKRQADESLRRYVGILRKMGASWTEVGTCIGVSAQAAQQRYGRDPT